MFCSHCGKPLATDALFCPSCGQKKAPSPADPAIDEPTAPEKSLMRIRNGRLLGGVAAGMAEYFGVGALGMRITWVVITICTVGTAAVGYLALCFIIPEEKA